MSKTDTSTAPPRKLPLWKRRPVLCTFLVLLVALITGGVIYYYVDSKSTLDEAFTEADEMDPGWRLPNLEGKRLQVPERENSALVLIAAKKLLPERWPVWQDKSYPENKDRSEADVQALQKTFDTPNPPGLLRDNEQQLLSAELKRAAPALTAARKVLDLPHGRYPLEFSADYVSTTLPHTQDARILANLFAYDAMLRAQEKDIDGALVSCRGILRISASIGDEPTATSMVVRLGIRQLAIRQIERALAQGQASEASLAALQKLLETEQKENLLLIGLRGERAGMEVFLQAVQNGTPSLSDTYKNLGGAVYSLAGVRTLTLPGAVNNDRAALLHWYNQAVEMAVKDTVEAERLAMERHEIKAVYLPPLAQLLHKNWIPLAQAWFQDQALLRCLVTAIAAERFRLAKGNWPSVAKELTPTYLAEVPTDVYAVTPLRVQRVPDGIGFYTVGATGALGTTQAMAGRSGVAPSAESGIRLWDPDKRRQEPKKPGKK